MRTLLIVTCLTAAAAVAETPDISGTWRLILSPYFFNVRETAQPGTAQPWADSLTEQRLENYTKDRWTLTCRPGGPALGLDRQIAKIVQTPALIVILYEDLTYRQIFLDGRSLSADPNPTWMGHSVGHWEGDTLVVDSAGFNDRTWLDYSGNPHTEALRIEERFRKLDNGRIDLAMTYTDPGAYTQPWTIHINVIRSPGAELFEYVCAENERDKAHLVGKVSDGALALPAEVLAKFAGTYLLGTVGPVRVEMVDGRLVADFLGKTKLIPRSATLFGGQKGTFQFTLDDNGQPIRLVVSTIEAEFSGERQKER